MNNSWVKTRHNLNLNNDIIFGDVGLETKVADALDASIAVAGVIKDLKVDRILHLGAIGLRWGYTFILLILRISI